MTIEIRQLVIRAVVTGDQRPERISEFEPVAPECRMNGTTPSQVHDSRQALVAACVREVLKKLERGQER